jgi:hypothetical protein
LKDNIMEAEAAQTDGAQLPAGVVQQATESISEHPETEKSEPSTNGRDDASTPYQGRVDLSSLPDDIRVPVENRIAHLTRTMGNQQRKFDGEINKWMELAKEQSEAINELRGGMTQVVDHLQDRGLREAEIKAQQDLKAAYESGDSQALVDANDKLAEIKARKIAADVQKKSTKQEPKPKQEERVPASGHEMASSAFNAGEITDGDLRAVEAWIAETDESGGNMRSWATSKNPNNPTADPVYRRALMEMAAVFDEASPWAHRPIDEKLAEIDRRMGVVKRSGGQTVMGGSLTSGKKSTKLSLSQDAMNLAIRTKFGGPKAKTDADHVEAYRVYREQLNKKGAR